MGKLERIIRNIVTLMRLLAIFSSLTVLCLSLCFCNNSIDKNTYYDAYSEGYSEGYSVGYGDGENDIFDVMYDELCISEEQRTKALRLVFEAVYDGDKIEDGTTWTAGDLMLKYHIEQGKYLYSDIKFQNFDIKSICSSYENYIDNFPITCYIGSYNERGEYEVYSECFTGENMFLYDNFVFTPDGYLTDYNEIKNNSDTLYILVFSNGKAYAATYDINSYKN